MSTFIDTGLRVRNNGSIYVNKKVFFSRPEVKNVIKKLKDKTEVKAKETKSENK